ncbi:hypothetical protein [Sphaerisporangium fuscum]|uniref:hypothetical protein n=1 Tax=Sphaerisporangium fuscum TaxID=2835868 RepID=UPI001BDC66CB|nr:hypothetical protein [Sphaerisporangium fuscum]
MTDRSDSRRRSPFFIAVLTLIGAFLLYLAIPNIGPTVRAARADGVPGVFTARTLSCVEHPGHESCSWSGEFQPDGGGRRRSPVTLYGSDRDSLRPGMRAKAVDVGRPSQVYGPGGSNEWVFTFLVLLAGAALVLFPWVRRTRRPSSPARTPGGTPSPAASRR